MTSNSLDNESCAFKSFMLMAFPTRKKTAFRDHFLSLPPLPSPPPPLKNANVIFIVFVGVLRGTMIRGNTTRNSERKMAIGEGL